MLAHFEAELAIDNGYDDCRSGARRADRSA
jgi:hypothetical protein